jgi:hypothetical protein
MDEGNTPVGGDNSLFLYVTNFAIGAIGAGHEKGADKIDENFHDKKGAQLDVSE